MGKALQQESATQDNNSDLLRKSWQNMPNPSPLSDAHLLNSKVFGRQMASRKRISRIKRMRGPVRKRGGPTSGVTT